MPVYIDAFSKIEKQLGIEDNGPAQAFLTETCYKKMDKYVPQDNGDLRTNVDVQTNRIIYESEYAGYQYYGQRKDGSRKVSNYTTPGTGPYWDKRMMSAEKQAVVREVQDYIRRK